MIDTPPPQKKKTKQTNKNKTKNKSTIETPHLLLHRALKYFSNHRNFEKEYEVFHILITFMNIRKLNEIYDNIIL